MTIPLVLMAMMAVGVPSAHGPSFGGGGGGGRRARARGELTERDREKLAKAKAKRERRAAKRLAGVKR